MTDAIDINIPIHGEMLHWGRRPTFEMVEQIADGYASDVSRWLIGAHTGTHVDAPSHFVPGGTTVDQIALDNVVGPVRVLDLRHVVEEITASRPRRGRRRGRRARAVPHPQLDRCADPAERSETWVGLGAGWRAVARRAGRALRRHRLHDDGGAREHQRRGRPTWPCAARAS